jgi:hypothetical protein
MRVSLVCCRIGGDISFVAFHSFFNTNKYTDRKFYRYDVMRCPANQSVLGLLYHHLEALDFTCMQVIQNAEKTGCVESEYTYYEHACDLYDSRLILKLVALLRACNTMYFYAPTGGDDDGHAKYLRNILDEIQKRQPHIRMDAKIETGNSALCHRDKRQRHVPSTTEDDRREINGNKFLEHASLLSARAREFLGKLCVLPEPDVDLSLFF